MEKNKTKKDLATKYKYDMGYMVSYWSPYYQEYMTRPFQTNSQADAFIRNLKADWDTKLQAYRGGI
jgi:conjugal transfer/entry exclusion protein